MIHQHTTTERRKTKVQGFTPKGAATINRFNSLLIAMHSMAANDTSVVTEIECYHALRDYFDFAYTYRQFTVRIYNLKDSTPLIHYNRLKDLLFMRKYALAIKGKLKPAAAKMFAFECSTKYKIYFEDPELY